MEPVSTAVSDSDFAREISVYVRHSLSTRSYEKALDAYSAAYRCYPHNREIRKGYIETAEAIKKAADAAFRKERFTEAGQIYYDLLKSGIRTDLSGALTFDSDPLTRTRARCKEALDSEAMKEYRAGNIGRALSLWKKILSFDPEDRDAAKAVSTATIQLRNLKRLRQ